jgi:hypothetical protein
LSHDADIKVINRSEGTPLIKTVDRHLKREPIHIFSSRSKPSSHQPGADLYSGEAARPAPRFLGRLVDGTGTAADEVVAEANDRPSPVVIFEAPEPQVSHLANHVITGKTLAHSAIKLSNRWENTIIPPNFVKVIPINAVLPKR